MPGDLPDGDVLGLLRGDVAAHELERLRPAGPLLGKDAHAGVADDDQVAAARVGHGEATGGHFRRIDENGAVHFLVGHFDPVPGDADFGPLVGRAVEILGIGAVDVGGNERAVATSVGTAPWSAISASSFCNSLFACRADFQHRMAGIVPQRADRDVLDRAIAAVGGHDIEDLGQNEAVDDVTADLDLFDERPSGGVLARRPRRLLRCLHVVPPAIGI